MSNNINNTKDQPSSDVICQKPNVSKCDRDLYRVCPSKLSKRELENLYFALFENNLELKKTLHSQTEKLKLLSTKLQRMTVLQRNAAGKEKDCCNSKMLLGEQKDIISDLKRANDQMAEKIRILNMRLCSAKQFLKKSSCQSVRCPKCGVCPVNWSATAVNARPSQASIKMNTTASQYVPTEAPHPHSPQKYSHKHMRTVETETEWKDNDSAEKHCNENKCRTIRYELKQEIVNLQEELSNAHTEYSNRISRLENDVSSLQQENIDVKAHAAASVHSLQRAEQAREGKGAELRRAQGSINDLEMQLSIERRKVKELETALKLASRPSEVAKLIEKFNAAHENMNRQKVEPTAKRVAVSIGPTLSTTPYFSNQTSSKQDNLQSPTSTASKSDPISSPAETKSKDVSKSDDSGYADLNKSTDAEDTKVDAEQLAHVNRKMMSRISELQAQVDTLRIKESGEPLTIKSLRSDIDIFANEKQMAVITLLDDRPNTVVQIQELGAKNYDSKPERDINTSTPVKAAIKSAESKSKMAERKLIIAHNKPATAESESVTAEYKCATSDNIPVIAENKRLITETKPLIAENESVTSENKPTIADHDSEKLDMSNSGIDECKVGLAPCNPQTVGCIPGVTECKPRTTEWQSVKADEPSTSTRADDELASWSEYMAKTTDGRGEKVQHRTSGQEIDVKIDISVEKTSNNAKRNDDDYRYQIPGPIPGDTSRENKKPCNKCRSCNSKRVVCECKGSKTYAVESDKSSEKKTDVRTNEIKTPTSKSVQKITIVEPNKNTITPKDSAIMALKAKDSRKKLCDEPVCCTPADSLTLYEKRLTKKCVLVEPSEAVDKASGISLKEEAIEKSSEQEMRKYDGSVNERVLDELAEVKQASNTSYYSRGVTAEITPVQSVVSEVTSWKTKEQTDTFTKDIEVENVREEGAMEKIEQCQARVTICRCPRAAGREVNMFRTCSGTLRLKTSGIGDEFRQCDRCSYGGADKNNEEFTPNDQEQDPADWASSTKIISTTPLRVVQPSEETSLMPRELGVIQMNQTEPVEIVDKIMSKRDYPTSTTPVRFEAASTATRRDSATYTATPPGRRDSATYTTAPPDRRDTIGFTPVVRRNSATFPVNLPPGRRDSATYTQQPLRKDSGTYAKPCEGGRQDCECKCLRAISADDTEKEISSLSDLPPEKEARSPPWSRRVYMREWAASPGELLLQGDPVSTGTDTDSSPRAAPLSAGEIPGPTQFRARTLSIGEKPPTSAGRLLQSSERQMEATLNAISAELPQCRKLLHAAQRERGAPAKEVNPPVGSVTSLAPRVPERVHKLHAAAKSPRLADTAPHTALFTLHIGTLVLSDEAVVKFGHASLCVSWQFWEQAGAMLRLRATRVVPFHFSTEYDVTFTDHFLAYMNQEEMPLTICDMSRPEEPLARCSLPLRDALIHTNRRVNMSLALLAGPAMSVWAGNAGSSPAAGDELGVLDLWCSLQAPPRLRTAINATIARVPEYPEEYKRQKRFSSLKSLGPSDPAISKTTRDFESKWRPSFVSNIRSPEEMSQAIEEISQTQSSVGSTKNAAEKHQMQKKTAVYAKEEPIVSEGLQDLIKAERKISTAASLSKQIGRMRCVPFGKNPRDDEPDSAVTKKYTDMFGQNSRDDALDSAVTKKYTDTFGQNSRDDEPDSAVTKKYTDTFGQNSRDDEPDSAVTKKYTDTFGQNSRDDEPDFAVTKKYTDTFGQNSRDDEPDSAVTKKYTDTFHKYSIDTASGVNRMTEASKKTVKYTDDRTRSLTQDKDGMEQSPQSIDITVLWLALNEECEAMLNPQVHRLYVAYTFLGRRGADLETPVSLPKPKHYADKCYFNFKKTLELHDVDLPLLGHMSRCRAGRAPPDPRDCIVFSVVSEPQEDPLGLSCCEDIGHAYLYLGDILAYSAGGVGYTEVLPVRAINARGQGSSSMAGYTAYSSNAGNITPGAVCGVLAVRVDGLDILRRCLSLSQSNRDLRLSLSQSNRDLRLSLSRFNKDLSDKYT